MFRSKKVVTPESSQPNITNSTNPKMAPSTVPKTAAAINPTTALYVAIVMGGDQIPAPEAR
jgi:hypothetical protein